MSTAIRYLREAGGGRQGREIERSWDGLEKQLPAYLTSDKCCGWFLAVRYDDRAVSVSRANDLPKRTASAARETGFDLRAEWIDARPKASASNL